MTYADIHIHALSGVDDGAQTQADMVAMIDMAYADGVRWMCFTPHFHPGWFGNNASQATAAMDVLHKMQAERWPQLRLFLGNELRGGQMAEVSWLQSGVCRTLNESRYVLVDFADKAERRTIEDTVRQLLGAGYIPLLAHVERYRALFGDFDAIRAMRKNGVLLQMDTTSPFGAFGFRVRRQSRALLKAGLLDVVSSDAHDLLNRKPGMSACYQYIKKKRGTAFAKAVCRDNAVRLLESGAPVQDYDKEGIS